MPSHLSSTQHLLTFGSTNMGFVIFRGEPEVVEAEHLREWGVLGAARLELLSLPLSILRLIHGDFHRVNWPWATSQLLELHLHPKERRITEHGFFSHETH